MNKWQLYTTNEIKPAGWLRRQLEIQAEGKRRTDTVSFLRGNKIEKGIVIGE